MLQIIIVLVVAGILSIVILIGFMFLITLFGAAAQIEALSEFDINSIDDIDNKERP